MSPDRSLLKPHTDVSRKTSLRSKLRAISLNRQQHKNAHFEEDDSSKQPDSPAVRLDSISSDRRYQVMESATPEKRGRSQGRQRQRIIMDDDQPSPDTGKAVTGSSALSQPQLATPILSTPTITGTDYAAISTPNKFQQSFTPVIEDVSAAGITVATPASPAALSSGSGGGFLSSMLNAATSLGTALSTGNPRSPPFKSHVTLENDNPTTLTPVRAPVGFQAETSVPPVATLGLGELSSKDIGLLQSPGGRDSSSAPATRARGGTNESHTGTLPVTDAAENSKVMRSGSISTARPQKRRNSTSMSVFGGEGQRQKITGFAVASNKRNREFHGTFRSVPEADYLLDDYGCALQKEILVHGRMYVSESHICFNSNIFGWVTNLVIAFTDITSVEKRSTAGIFPNAIQISTLQAKHFFASFISRETTYDLIVNIWRLTHPYIQTTAHGVAVAEEEDDSYNSDLSESSHSGTSDSASVSIDDVDGVEDGSALARMSTHSPRDSPNITTTTITAPESSVPSEVTQFPGPKQHAPTEAPSLHDGTAFPKHLLDECFQAPLGQIYELLYGDDTTFLSDFLITNQKLLDVQINQFADRGAKSMRSMSYVKPLNSPVGPKQTRCLLDDVIELKDFENCVQVIQSTTSPDVPSGDNFVIKTRFSLMWGPDNSTRLVSNCVIEWSKNSWLKGPIEKGANNGQVQFMADLSEAIKTHLALASPNKSKKTKNRKTRTNTKDSEAPASAIPNRSAAQQPTTTGGMFGPLSGLIDNINTNALILVLLFGTILSMVRLQRTVRDLASDRSRQLGSTRLAETRWQHEEADLWTWLADRTVDTTQLDRAHVALGDAEAAMTSLQIKEALKHQVAVLKLAGSLHSDKTSPAS